MHLYTELERDHADLYTHNVLETVIAKKKPIVTKRENPQRCDDKNSMFFRAFLRQAMGKDIAKELLPVSRHACHYVCQQLVIPDSKFLLPGMQGDWRTSARDSCGDQFQKAVYNLEPALSLPVVVCPPETDCVSLKVPVGGSVFWHNAYAREVGCWLIELIKRVLRSDETLLLDCTDTWYECENSWQIVEYFPAVWTDEINSTSCMLPILDMFFQEEIQTATRTRFLALLISMPSDLVELILSYRFLPSWREYISIRIKGRLLTDEGLDTTEVDVVHNQSGAPLWLCRRSLHSTHNFVDSILDITP